MNDPQDADEGLTRAARLLRQHTDTGWTVLRPGLLDQARRVFRSSGPVRGRHELGDYFVREDVLTDQVRQAVDEIPDAAAAAIECVTDDQDELTALTVQISASYGAHLPTLAARVHATTHATVVDLLGDLAPGIDAVHTHVHIDDVVDDRSG